MMSGITSTTVAAGPLAGAAINPYPTSDLPVPLRNVVGNRLEQMTQCSDVSGSQLLEHRSDSKAVSIQPARAVPARIMGKTLADARTALSPADL